MYSILTTKKLRTRFFFFASCIHQLVSPFNDSSSSQPT